MSAWMLCSVLAGLAGVLLAPLFAAVSEFNYTTLVVVATDAALDKVGCHLVAQAAHDG